MSLAEGGYVSSDDQQMSLVVGGYVSSDGLQVSLAGVVQGGGYVQGVGVWGMSRGGWVCPRGMSRGDGYIPGVCPEGGWGMGIPWDLGYSPPVLTPGGGHQPRCKRAVHIPLECFLVYLDVSQHNEVKKCNYVLTMKRSDEERLLLSMKDGGISWPVQIKKQSARIHHNWCTPWCVVCVLFVAICIIISARYGI